jgi:hypothetical protein
MQEKVCIVSLYPVMTKFLCERCNTWVIGKHRAPRCRGNSRTAESKAVVEYGQVYGR